ncbi:MAG: diacylglycerol kinase family lipid kinase [Chloroflexi bacterium]|nr:diacylglycerol kinase family lipid kinase [Chloroflexota bacterium]
MPSADILFNPVAGRISAEGAVHKAAALLEAAGWQMQVLRSRSGRHTTHLARQAARSGRDAVFVAGGDGTLGETVRGLLGSDTALGVLPSGTANVWAQELGYATLTAFRPGALEEAARAQAEGWTQWMDVGLCNLRPFLLWTGVGLDGEVVRQMESQRAGRRRFPYLLYSWQILRSIVRWRGLRLSMEVDGQPLEDRYILALVSNIRLYNGGFTTLAQRNCVDDGQLDLWLFKGEHPADSFRYVVELLSNRHHDDPAVTRHTFERIAVTGKYRFILQMDGDAVGAPRRLEITARPRALRVLVPPQPPAGLFSRPPERIP